MKAKLKLLLKQPPDAEILESIRRKEEQLKKLADKPLSSLSGQEAFLLISGRNLAYADAPDLFHLWWGSLDKGTQKQINSKAEDFADLTDYVWKSMQGPVLHASQATLGVKTLYAQFQQQLPKISQAQFERLWLAGKQRSRILRRGKHRSTVKIFIDDYLADSRRLLYEAFSIAPNRPVVEQDRDRQFSKSDYEDPNYALAPADLGQGYLLKYDNTKEKQWIERIPIPRIDFELPFRQPDGAFVSRLDTIFVAGRPAIGVS